MNVHTKKKRPELSPCKDYNLWKHTFSHAVVHVIPKAAVAMTTILLQFARFTHRPSQALGIPLNSKTYMPNIYPSGVQKKGTQAKSLRTSRNCGTQTFPIPYTTQPPITLSGIQSLHSLGSAENRKFKPCPRSYMVFLRSPLILSANQRHICFQTASFSMELSDWLARPVGVAVAEPVSVDVTAIMPRFLFFAAVFLSARKSKHWRVRGSETCCSSFNFDSGSSWETVRSSR